MDDILVSTNCTLHLPGVWMGRAWNKRVVS